MKISIIGIGAMGSCLAKGLMSSTTLQLFDKNPDKANGFNSPEEAVKECDLVILAVKPKDMEALLKLLRSKLTPDQIVISVAGNIDVAFLENHLPESPVVRIMPNTPCAVGKGVIGIVESKSLTPDVKSKLEAGLSPLGHLHYLPESQIDALTALAGSAPAFAFVILEAMIDAGIEMGLKKPLSQELVTQMWEGSLELLKTSGKNTTDLKWQVASPGGITIAGLDQMEQDKVRAGLLNTLMTTWKRAISKINY